MNALYRSEAAEAAVRAQYRHVLDGWPVPSQQRHVQTRYGETFVVSCGPPQAPPVVLCHGAQANVAAWMFDAALWSQHFRLHAVDRIGDAGFSAPTRPPLESEDHALWQDDVWAALGIERAAMVGTSLGGWVALDYASRRPQRVSRLALMCPAGIGAQKNFLAKALPLMLLGPWGQRKVMEMVFGPRPQSVPEAERPFSELMGLIGRAYRPRDIKIPRLSDTALAALPMPILCIVGGRDVLLDSDDTRARLSRARPDADIRYLPDAPHYIAGQAAAIDTFLRSDQETPAT